MPFFLISEYVPLLCAALDLFERSDCHSFEDVLTMRAHSCQISCDDAPIVYTPPSTHKIQVCAVVRLDCRPPLPDAVLENPVHA